MIPVITQEPAEVLAKHCLKCGDWLPLDFFGRDKTRSDGRVNYCRVCVRLLNRENYAKKRRAPKLYVRGPYKKRGRVRCGWAGENCETFSKHMTEIGGSPVCPVCEKAAREFANGLD